MNQQAIAYRNGTFPPADQLHVAVQDGGFVQGLTVAEQMRTFAGRLFRWSDHLRRFRRSLEIVGVEIATTDAELETAALRIVEHNHALLDPGGDLALVMFATPGPYASMAAEADPGPVVVMHTYPLPFASWAEKYAHGQALATTPVLQVPAACWPRELKCRSRMHYYLADRHAARMDPQARALLLDADGFIVEASTANVFAYFAGEGFVSPPAERILPGVTLKVWESVIDDLGEPFQRRDLRVEDVLAADELFLCSTSMCGLAAVRLDHQPIGAGRPGPQFARLIQAFSELAGVDVVEQARRHS